MLLSCQEQAPRAWAELHFDACDLSDLRRTERVVMVAAESEPLEWILAHFYPPVVWLRSKTRLSFAEAHKPGRHELAAL